MSDAEQLEQKIEDLPPKFGDYVRRVMVLDNFVVIEYSKRQLFIRYIHPNSFTSKEVEDNLLFDVVANSMEKAVREMKKKIDEYQSKQKNRE